MGYCPECQSEYIESVSRCPSCELDLVDQLPVEEEQATVYRSSELLEANLVRETLDAEGIDAMVLSHEEHVFPTQAGGPVHEVRVPLSAEKRAHKHIAQAREGRLFGAFAIE